MVQSSDDGTTDTGTEESFEPPPSGGLAKAVSSGRTVLVCDSPPLDGSARASGFLDIRGWAFSRAGLDGVFVCLDGLRHRARLGVSRLDVAGLPGVDLTRSGFDLTIELDADQVGQLPVTIVARGTNGHAVGVRGTVDCRPEQEPPVASRGHEDGVRPPGLDALSSIGGPFEQQTWPGVARSMHERVLIAEAEASAGAAEARAARLQSARSLQLLQLAEHRRREVESSLSWRITRPLRMAAHIPRSARRTLRPARRALGSVRRALRPARRVLRSARRGPRRGR